MNRLFPLITAALLVSGVGIAAWQTGALDEYLVKSHGAIEACEEIVIKGLRSPSTYHRLSSQYRPTGPMTYEEFVANEDTHGCPDMVAKMGLSNAGCIDTNRFMTALAATMDWQHHSDKTVRKFSRKARTEYLKYSYELYKKWPAADREGAVVELEYDAANAYNTPIRSSQFCRFSRRIGGKFDASEVFDPSVDAMF